MFKNFTDPIKGQIHSVPENAVAYFHGVLETGNEFVALLNKDGNVVYGYKTIHDGASQHDEILTPSERDRVKEKNIPSASRLFYIVPQPQNTKLPSWFDVCNGLQTHYDYQLSRIKLANSMIPGIDWGVPTVSKNE